MGIMFLMGLNFAASIVMNRVLARTFGATDLSDTFFRILQAVPFYFFTVCDNLFQTCVIPQVTALRSKRSSEDIFRLLQTVATVGCVILAVLVISLWVFKGGILQWIQPDWVGEAGRVPSEMADWLFPSVFLLGITVFGKHVLNSFGDHYTAAIVSIPRHLVLALVVLFVGARWGLKGAAIGFFMGCACQLIPVAIGLARHKFRPVYPKRSDWPEVVRFLKFLGFPAVGIVALYFTGPFEAKLGEYLDEGVMTTFYYGRRISGMLGLIFWSSLSVVTHTRASEAWGAGQREEALHRLTRALRYGSLIGIPSVLFGLTARYLLLGLALAGKRFGYHDLDMTATHIMFLLPATLVVCYSSFFNSFLLTVGKGITLAVVNIVNLILTVSFYAILVWGFKMRDYGLSIGYCAGALIMFPICYLVFRNKVSSMPIGTLAIHGAKIGISAAAACIVPLFLASHYASKVWGTVQAGGEADYVILPALIGLAGMVASFIVVFFPLLTILRIGECRELLTTIPVLGKMLYKRHEK